MNPSFSEIKVPLVARIPLVTKIALEGLLRQASLSLVCGNGILIGNVSRNFGRPYYKCPGVLIREMVPAVSLRESSPPSSSTPPPHCQSPSKPSPDSISVFLPGLLPVAKKHMC
ncbi:uncharacterized protein LOC110928726 isoform X1 [Helianthus annuus]|uniref:uncharacterized protein LOC110928726 isoform X1 n=1 Tax=Helianthus annuus TaxID=4232 RepID=UPI001653169E|nr:uncharacterized protein LOC110928726 isoform X1 [Helianthus annuus]